MNKYLPKIIFITLFSNLSFAQQLLDQNVNISSGSTLSHPWLPVRQLTGGPFTINNAGTIESTNGSTIRMDVDTTLNNSGLIDADMTTNGQAIQFYRNSGNNSLTNSGTIQAETTGQYGFAIKVINSSLTDITNSSGGTIEVTDSAYLSGAIRIDPGGSVNTITNNGTITATGTTHSRGIISIGTGATIDRINNTGTIQAQGGSVTNYGMVFWNTSGTTVTNSGTIQGTGGNRSYGILLGSNGNISSITNTGTILGGKDGIGNDGHITNIVNTGTITGTAGYDINNGAGSITNLTNSQNNLTYLGRLPTNYYVKVNSSLSYGKITFSNPLGSMNVGIGSGSTLSQGTYVAVIDGVTSSNISNSSGTYGSNANYYKYSLINSSGNQWDLIVNDVTQVFPPDTQCAVNSGSSGCTKTTTDVTSSVENGMNVIAINNGNFAHMNTYDCNTFGDSLRCLSIGGRSLKLNNPKSGIDGLVLVYGKKESPNFRWGAFLHSNVSYHTSANLKLTQNTPLLGFYGVWNENDDHTGLQFKVGTSHEATNAKIIRSVVGVSDQAEGNTEIRNNRVIFELRNNKKISDNFILSPYVATFYSKKYQKGYTETGTNLPITYKGIIDTSITAITGIKFKKEINLKNIFYGSIGIEHDVSHDISALSPTGISGLTTVDLTQNHRATRPVISLGLDRKISENQILRIKGQYQELPYGKMNETNLYVSYNYMF